MTAHMVAILWQFHGAAAGLAYMYDRKCTEISHLPQGGATWADIIP